MISFFYFFFFRCRAQLIDGKKVAAEIYKELSAEVQSIVSAGRRAPHLVLVRVGDDPASSSYVKNKMKAAEKIGEFPSASFLIGLYIVFKYKYAIQSVIKH